MVGTFPAMTATRHHEFREATSSGMTESVVGVISPEDPVRRFRVGDNIDALRDWGGSFAGKAALVLADPPYNARNIKDYEDDLAHEAWLEETRVRLELCIPLLRPGGILAVHIDDSEHAYLQMELDRILGRANRLNTVVVKMSELAGVKMRYQKKLLPRIKEYLLLYGAGPDARLRPMRRSKDESTLSRYLHYYAQFLENPSDPPEDWRVVSLRDAMASGHSRSEAATRAFQIAHADQVIYRTNNRWFDSLPEQERPSARFARLSSPWGIEYVWWEGRQMLFLRDHLDEPLSDIWTDISTINVQREGGAPLRSSKKPEALVHRVVSLCTEPGDIVVDPWAGSGTTAAVAHKTRRGWLSCERDATIAARALDRLDRVCTGLDPTGISEAVGWKGGGGFIVEAPANRTLQKTRLRD